MILVLSVIQKWFSHLTLISTSWMQYNTSGGINVLELKTLSNKEGNIFSSPILFFVISYCFIRYVISCYRILSVVVIGC